MFGTTPPSRAAGRSDNGSSHSSSHNRSHSASSDFGDFHSAGTPIDTHHHRPGQNFPSRLEDTDLLGSFDEFDEMQPPLSAPPFSLHQGLDFFNAGDAESTPLGSPQAHTPLRRLTSRSSIGGSPTQSRYMWSSDFPGPSSPPRVTDAHIMVHAPPQKGGDDAAAEFRRLRRMSDEYTVSGSLPRTVHHSPTRSRPSIADTFATSRLASKWKRSVLSNSHFGGGGGPDDGPTKTAELIDVNHKSPFATAQQIAGTYVAPTGAPAFKPGRGDLHDDEDEYANTTLMGRRELTEPVLEVAQARELRALLPARQRLTDSWNLLFSLDQHGASLSTLYRQTEKYAKDHRMGSNLLAVKDSDGHVFGVFFNEPIMKREGTYYGSGESFMFKFEAGKSKPHVFRWTGRNQYIALCETGFISFGGGGNSYGLLLDATFSRNSSSTSPAFDNAVLCGDGIVRSDKAQPFDCIGVEVWGTA